VQPKLGPAIPPYNSHYDKHVQNYFTYKGVEDTLTKTGQVGVRFRFDSFRKTFKVFLRRFT